MDGKTSEWRPGPSVCRCCLAEGCYKDISTEYFWMGKREVYSEMLSETFSVSIAYSSSGGPNSNSRLICEPCISRLRDAADFKRQVQECEKTFMQHLDPGGTSTVPDLDIQVLPEEKEVKLEQVKLEKRFSDDEFDNVHFADDDDDDMDDQPLTKFATKVPKKETVDFLDLIDNSQITVKRKSTTKTKTPPTKKVKVTKKEAKPTASKAPIKIVAEKKKKGLNEDSKNSEDSPIRIVWKRKRGVLIEDKANAAIILKYSNAVVFRWQRGKFMCAYCPQMCTNVAAVRSHSTIHSNKLDIFEKPEVRNSFPLRVDITDLSCDLCNKRVHSIDGLKTHLAQAHSHTTNPKYTDGVIPFVLTGKEFKCVHCGTQYEGFMKLFIHMNNHYQSFICHICGKGYSAKHKLSAHRKSHEMGEFQCSKCDMVFPSRPAKNRHVAAAHARKEKYRCPLCDEYFDSYHSRLRHLDKIHGQKTEYKCSLCSAVFGTATLRYSHIKIVHMKKKKNS